MCAQNVTVLPKVLRACGDSVKKSIWGFIPDFFKNQGAGKRFPRKFSHSGKIFAVPRPGQKRLQAKAIFEPKMGQN